MTQPRACPSCRLLSEEVKRLQGLVVELLRQRETVRLELAGPPVCERCFYESCICDQVEVRPATELEQAVAALDTRWWARNLWGEYKRWRAERAKRSDSLF